MIGPIILQIVLIFLNATFASAEIAVISMNDNKSVSYTHLDVYKRQGSGIQTGKECIEIYA